MARDLDALAADRSHRLDEGPKAPRAQARAEIASLKSLGNSVGLRWTDEHQVAYLNRAIEGCNTPESERLTGRGVDPQATGGPTEDHPKGNAT
jgi:hypothetical protein